ncbi:MAG: type IV pilus assembly protein PilM [Bacteroidota bacterium]
MAKSCVGLDIGTSAVKAAQISQAGDNFILNRVGVAPIPIGAIEGGAVQDIPTVAQAVSKLLRQTRIPARRVMPAVAGQAVIVRSLKFPAMPREQLAEAVKWEAERYIPFPVNEAVIDFDVTGTVAETGEQEIMLVAAQRSIIESHVAVLKAAGLQTMAMDVQPFALARSLNAHILPIDGQAANVAMIDVGAGTTDLVIFRDEVLRFTRIIPIGGTYFTRAIAGRLGMTEDEAESLKITRGQVPLGENQQFDSAEDAQLCSVIGAVMGELVTEIRRSIDYFRLQYHEDVSRIVATGGGIMLRNMVISMERELGLRVETGDPIGQLHPNSRQCAPELLAMSGPIFCVAVGLALRGVQGE